MMLTTRTEYRLCSYLCVGVLLADAALCLFSWVGSTEGMNMQSMLTVDGLRWLFSHMASMLASPPLVYMLCFLSLLGGWKVTGLNQAVSMLLQGSRSRLSFRQRSALQVSVAFLLLMFVLLLLALFLPHAILRSVTGNLMLNSPFSRSAVLLFYVVLQIHALMYGLLGGHLRRGEDVLRMFTDGVSVHACWLAVYFVLRFTQGMVEYIFYHNLL